MVAAMVIGSGIGAACGGDGGRPTAGSSPRRRDPLDHRRVWAAVGADPGDVDVAEYAHVPA